MIHSVILKKLYEIKCSTAVLIQDKWWETEDLNLNSNEKSNDIASKSTCVRCFSNCFQTALVHSASPRLSIFQSSQIKMLAYETYIILEQDAKLYGFFKNSK